MALVTMALDLNKTFLIGKSITLGPTRYKTDMSIFEEISLATALALLHLLKTGFSECFLAGRVNTEEAVLTV